MIKAQKACFNNMLGITTILAVLFSLDWLHRCIEPCAKWILRFLIMSLNLAWLMITWWPDRKKRTKYDVDDIIFLFCADLDVPTDCFLSVMVLWIFNCSSFYSA